MEQYANEPNLYLLLKDFLKTGELTYEKRGDCYFAEKDGYVDFYHYVGPSDGYGGRHFTITMKDGSEKILEGPWSSRASVMNREGFTPCIEATITESKEVWAKGYTFYASAVTVEVAKQALELLPTVLLRKRVDRNGEINYRIREIGKTLEQSKGERRK
jgi:hypothetical protein